ncbi:MAG: SusC/RagA family TonB-linked outer membrane protein [Cytophagales bacterium]|nr:SusC/RagA family TonB-linked outer membrane protein [Cytophagales bacterium]
MIASSGNAQTVKSVREAHVNINFLETSIMEAFRELEFKTNYTFAFDITDIDQNLKLSVKKGNYSVADILTEISKAADLKFRQVDNNIHVSKKLSINQSTLIIENILQTRTITGVVTSEEDNEGLPGVNVVEQGTTNGTVTDVSGRYALDVPEGTTLVFSSVGYSPEEIVIGDRSVIDVVMVPDITRLQEIVVTGVVTGTPKKKLGFTVEKVSGDILQNVPATNVATTLAGKVPGLKVSANSGAPGTDPNVQLRSVTTIFGSSNPLIIVDGVLTEGGFSDINVEDIASIEVVKGASASSLYGSRAANGVINITTKRGSGLKSGTSEVNYRTEIGQSYIPFIPEKTTAINVEVEDGTVDYDSPSPDGVYDNKYPSLTDPVGQFFNPGLFMTHYLSFSGNSNAGKTSLFSSVQYTDEEGVAKLANGRQRINFRLNLDHNVSEKLKVKASNLYAESVLDNRANGIWDMFYYADPDVDLLAPNEEDGSPYNVNPNSLNPRLANPLYNIHNTINEEERSRFIGNYAIEYDLLENLRLSAAYGLDKIVSNGFSLSPKGLLRADNPDLRTNGSISESTSTTTAQTLQADALYFRQLGDFNTKFRVQYLYENNDVNWFNASGTHLAVLGMDVRSLEQASDNINISSGRTSVVANNYSAVFQVDYKDKYIFDGLYRRDGVSLFGANERWQNFYRISGAWRITKDIRIDGINELKLRASYGTAGLRPPFSAQYDVVFLTDGTANPGGGQKGNPDLRNSFSKELELGFDAEFLNRFTLSFNYANSVNTDQILEVPISATTGYVTQWQNAGTLEADIWEASLGINVIRNKNVSWDVNLLYDRITQTVKELNREGYAIVSGGIFRIEEGEDFGTLFGRKWARSLEDVANQVPEGRTLEDYFTINNQGYVVRTETIGTIEEEPVQIRDDEGFVEEKIGSVIPDFNVNFSSNLTWKNFTFYMLLGYQQGGQTYNHMRRYMMVNGVGATLDQSGLSRNAVKSDRYYDRLTVWNNEYFVEDATFFKMRELSLGYLIDGSHLNNFLGLKRVKVSLIGRNLFALTNYSGFDPETGQSEEGLDSNVLKFDLSSYPNFATVSGSIQVTF